MTPTATVQTVRPTTTAPVAPETGLDVTSVRRTLRDRVRARRARNAHRFAALPASRGVGIVVPR